MKLRAIDAKEAQGLVSEIKLNLKAMRRSARPGHQSARRIDEIGPLMDRLFNVAAALPPSSIEGLIRFGEDALFWAAVRPVVARYPREMHDRVYAVIESVCAKQRTA